MFGFTLLALLTFVSGISALELGGTISADGKLSYTKEADETFAYQVVRISKAEWDSVSGDVADGLKQVEESTKMLSNDLERYENSVSIYEKAKEDYEVDPTEDKKQVMDVAEADMEAAFSYMEQTLTGLKDNMTSTMNFIKKVAPYDVNAMTEVNDNATSGEISVDMTDANDDDVYVVWIKSDEYQDLSDDSVLIGEIYTKDGVLAPTLPDDTEIPTVPTDTKKEENVKNPKTGVDMPIALGVSAIALAGAAMFIVCKKQLFKQL